MRLVGRGREMVARVVALAVAEGEQVLGMELTAVRLRGNHTLERRQRARG